MTITLAPEIESRVLAAATRRNRTPEAIVDAALEEYLRNEPAQDAAAQEADEEVAYQKEQARLRRLLLTATEEAKLVQPYGTPSCALPNVASAKARSGNLSAQEFSPRYITGQNLCKEPDGV